MKRIFSLALAAAVLFLGISNNVQAQSCEVGCCGSSGIGCAADLGYIPDCGSVSCYGDDNCYETCGSGCFGGIGGLFSGACSIVMTPIHWFASVFTCGSFPDCGCAPLQQECYSNPCDICGNYVGECGGCGNPYYGYTYQDYYMANQQAEGAYNAAPATEPVPATADPATADPATAAPAAPQGSTRNPSLYNNSAAVSRSGAVHGDYVNYSKVETIGQKKLRRRMEQQAQMVPAENQTIQAERYAYSEQVYEDAAVPTQIPSRAAIQKQVRPNNPQTRTTASARPVQKRSEKAVRTARSRQNSDDPYRY